MTLMTHSDEVSTGCQPCPTDSHGEVVTSIKKNLLICCGPAQREGCAVISCKTTGGHSHTLENKKEMNSRILVRVSHFKTMEKGQPFTTKRSHYLILLHLFFQPLMRFTFLNDPSGQTFSFSNFHMAPSAFGDFDGVNRSQSSCFP